MLPLKTCTLLVLLAAVAASHDDQSLSKEAYQHRYKRSIGSVMEKCSKVNTFLKALGEAMGKKGYNIAFVIGDKQPSVGVGMLVPAQKFFELIKSVMEKLAPALGVAGPLFSLVIAFMPKKDSAELQAIKEGFSKVNLRFDVIERKLELILTAIDKNTIYTEYKRNQDRLYAILLKYNSFLASPNDLTLQELTHVCQQEDPEQTLDWIHRHTTKEQIEPELLPTVLKVSGYNRKELIEWFKIIVSDATQASYLRQMCLGVVYNNKTEYFNQTVDSSMKKLNEIVKKMQVVEAELVENFVDKQLEDDVKLSLANAEGKADQEQSQGIWTFLSTKYDWLSWAVHVFKSEKASKVNGCSNSFKNMEERGKRIVVTWQDKSLENEGIQVLNTTLDKYKPSQSCVGSNGFFFGADLDEKFSNLYYGIENGVHQKFNLLNYTLLLVKSSRSDIGSTFDPSTAVFDCKGFTAAITYCGELGLVELGVDAGEFDIIE